MTDRSEKVADALRRAFPAGPPAGEAGGWLNPALDVLDCVLSLNRNYDRFCLPRVNAFAKQHPEVTSLKGLLGLIASYRTPLAFSITELAYQDERRAETLIGVTRYLATKQGCFSGPTEAQRLSQWAVSAKPSDYLGVGVPGFGLSGFQYLRILLGAQAVKPDIYIQRFVSTALGEKAGDVEALTLLEEAGQHLGWRLADLDYAIWDRGARGSLKSVDFAETKPRLPRGFGDAARTTCAPSMSMPRCEFETAYKSAPVCWAYDSANPRFIYLSRDNRESTQAAYRFDYAEVVKKLKVGRLSKRGYRYFELAP